MICCEWCGNTITSWYLKYKGKNFCRSNSDSCLKNYLFDEADKEISEERTDCETEYRMDMVTFMEQRGLD